MIIKASCEPKSVLYLFLFVIDFWNRLLKYPPKWLSQLHDIVKYNIIIVVL